MNIKKIKRLNDIVPFWIKRPFSKVIRRQLINNPVFLRQYQELEQAESLSENEKKKVQETKIKEILQHAYAHTSYYHNLFDSIGLNPSSAEPLTELEKIPILTKELLEKNYDALSADNIQDFYDVSTGGTSGKPVNLLMEREAIFREWAFVYHYWSKFGYDYRKSRLATLRGIDFNGKYFIENPLYMEIRLNPMLMNRNNIAEYIKRVKAYKATFLYGYPSSVYNFCKLSEENHIDISKIFKGVFLISENLYPFQEEKILHTTKCPIAIFYGHSERAVFAERYSSGYKFNSYYGKTEISQTGEPVVTGFINKKMPLIRYVVDDKAEVIQDGIYHISGHHDSEVLCGINGEEISAAMINFHDDTFDGVEAYQFVQSKPGRCVLRVQTGRPLTSVQSERILGRIRNKLGGIVCTVERVDKIELTKRGKYKMVIQDWEKADGHETENINGGTR